MKRLIALAVASSTGCSVFMTDAPPTLSPIMPPDCSSSRAAPIVDVIGAASTAYVGLVIYALSGIFGATHEDRQGQHSGEVAAAAIGIGGTTAYIASAVHGFNVSSRCREATSTWYLTLAPNAPNPIGPPPLQPGSERGWCRPPPGAPCDPGLTCASNRCVIVAPFVAPPLQPAQ